MTGKSIDLGMTALDELFMTDQERQENKLPKVHEIPLELIVKIAAKNTRTNQWECDAV